MEVRQLNTLIRAAQFQSFFNYRCKIFLFIDMNHLRIRYDLCGKHTIGIAWFYRHQTVGCK